MNKDRGQGKAKDIAGRVKRQAGEWTGNEEKQVEGAAEQAEGKIQNTFGKLKDKAAQVTEEPKQRERERNRDRKIERDRRMEDREIDEDAA